MGVIIVKKKECLEKYKTLCDIDVTHDFSMDSECKFWLSDGSFGDNGNDPDAVSLALHRYHCLLWNKELPNGEQFDLDDNLCLYHDQTKRFGADTIINLYTHHNNSQIRSLLNRLQNNKNYLKKDTEYIHKSYTIGGNIVFPKHKPSINTIRGNIYGLADRIDLTMECIRIWYKDKNRETPLRDVINDYDAWFFEKFESFEKYIDFFLLQDLVRRKNGKYQIKFFLKRNAKKDESGCSCDLHGYPKTLREWRILYRKEMGFLKKRNKRIAKYIRKQCKVRNKKQLQKPETRL